MNKKNDATSSRDILILSETGTSSNSYLIRSDNGYCLIDPSHPVADVSQDIDVTSIIATHGHYDHIKELNDWRNMSARSFSIHMDEKPFLHDVAHNASALFGDPKTFEDADIWLSEGMKISLDTRRKLSVIHTPGHTAGSVCLLMLVEDQPVALFTGDTLFKDSIGRTDFPSGNMSQMRASLQRLSRLFEELPQDLPVFCGHGPQTTVGREKSYNYMMRL